MTALNSDEKTAGRLFRAASQEALDKLNKASPPDQLSLVQWRVVRHVCPDEGDASIGITLREHYEPSPEYRVCYCGVKGPADREFPHRACDGSKVLSRGGRFAWI